MPQQIKGYRVFIASPGGLQAERRRFRQTISEYNEDEALARGVTFIPVGWEDTLSGTGRPQEIINEDVKKSDCFVLLLWDRWGSPPAVGRPKYTSGTEEELAVALRCLSEEDEPMRRIVLLFKGVDERQLSDPGTELQKVLNFKRRIEESKLLLYQTFDTEDEFARVLRRHLGQWVRDDELEETKQPALEPPMIDSLLGHGLEEPAEEPKLADDSLDDAERLAAQGKMADAEARFARAVVGRSSIDAALRYGRFLRRLDRLSHSTAMFERVIQLADDQDRPRDKAWAIANLGVIARKEGELDKAEKLFEQALELTDARDSDGSSELLTYIYGNLAQLYGARGDLSSAEVMQRHSLEIQLESGDKVGIANSYGHLGVLLRKKGAWHEAEQAHREGIKFSEKLGEQGDRMLAYNCGSLGLVLSHLEEYDEAIGCHERALSVNERLDRTEGRALNHSHLAAACLAKGELEDAERHNRTALELNSKRGNIEGIAYNKSTEAGILKEREQFKKAETAFKNSIELFEQVGKRRAASFNRIKLAKLWFSVDDRGKGLELLEEAEEDSRDLHDASLATAVDEARATLGVQ